MSAPLMWLFIAFVAVAGLLCNTAAWLWMSAKWCRIPNVSYWRALGAAALIGAMSILIQAVGFWLSDWASRNTPRTILVNGLATLGVLAFAVTCIRLVLRTTSRRALAATFISMTVSGVLAVGVALGIRVFVMESFVTPMGSMALAVLGRHFDVTCDRCGLPSVVSANGRYQMRLRAQGLPSFDYSGNKNRVQSWKCANCGNEGTLPDDFPITDGDRILVDKLGKARRWDVVVFRFPEQIATIYLKRLVGLPGETVEIIGGDIFINGRLEAKPFGIASDMWLLVNDTRYAPARSGAEDPQWQPVDRSLGWRRTQTGWECSGASDGPHELEFSGPLNDKSYYSERWADEPIPPDYEPVQQVGDVQITCTLRQFAGKGALAFRWEFRGLKAGATLSADGGVELRTENETRQTHLPLPLSSVREVAFAVRDGVVILAADGREAATLLVGSQDSDAAREAAGREAEPCQIALAADHCDLELSRIVIERDVYYTNLDPDCTGCTGHSIVLGSEEHYVLGDHSVRSNDSRLWRTVDQGLRGSYQVGTVPSELMLGPARCIYWPPHRLHEFR